MQDPPEDLTTRLSPFSLATLERHGDSAYSIDPDGRVFYVNPAWDEFARDNGGSPAVRAPAVLGTDLFAAIPTPLRAFYKGLFEVAVEDGPQPARGPVRHTYECSSEALYRRFQMSVYPLDRGNGVMIVNAKVLARAHDAALRPAVTPADHHVDAHGMVHQCCHCRRMKNLAHPGRWDWVPAWVKRCPEGASHTICDPCFDFYYRSAPMPG